jgi:uncharacterized membrane protein
MFDIPLHKLIVHFPIVLTVVGLLYDAQASRSHRPDLHRTGYSLSLWAALTALVAVVTGLQRASELGLDTGSATGHAGFGIASTIVLAGFGFWRYSMLAMQRREFDYYPVPWMVLQTVGLLLILATAITGHTIFG